MFSKASIVCIIARRVFDGKARTGIEGGLLAVGESELGVVQRTRCLSCEVRVNNQY